MKYETRTVTLSTEKKLDFIDITREIQLFVRNCLLDSATVLVYCPHTTAAITINESADPDVPLDIAHFLKSAIPDMPGFRHAEGNSSAHVMASLFSSQALLMVRDGKILLGRWQGVFFCEFDGPRTRKVILKVISRDEDPT